MIAVPNVSEGRDEAVLDAVQRAFEAAGARVLSRTADPDHHRAVFALEAPQGTLAGALAAGAREAAKRIDLRAHDGIHPRVGALDVAPVVFRDVTERGAACAEALVAADRIAQEAGVPVHLYGLLAGGRTRAELRRALHHFEPDFPAPAGPAGATLVAARPPLIAFNVDIDAPLAAAKAIAARVRELPGVVALGLELERQRRVQVSTNIEDHRATTPREVVALVAAHAPVIGTELVAPAPRDAEFARDVELRGAELRIL